MNRKILNVILLGLILLTILYAPSCKTSTGSDNPAGTLPGNQLNNQPDVYTTLSIESIDVDVARTENGYQYTVVVHLKASADGDGVDLTNIQVTFSFYRENQLLLTDTIGKEAFSSNHVAPSSIVSSNPLVYTDDGASLQATLVSLAVNYSNSGTGTQSISAETDIPELKFVPTIEYFNLKDSKLEYGESTTLSWKVKDADNITLYYDGKVEEKNVKAESSIKVSAFDSGTHYYKLEATNTEGSAEKTVEINVDNQINYGGPIVYITDTGSKYHNAGCRYLDQSQKAIHLEEAKAKGYEPCKVCDPPK